MTDILRLVANGAAGLEAKFVRIDCRRKGALKSLKRPPLRGGLEWRMTCR